MPLTRKAATLLFVLSTLPLALAAGGASAAAQSREHGTSRPAAPADRHAASSPGMVITAEGTPLLPAPTTPRRPQSGDAATRCARLSGLLLEDVGRMLRFLHATDAQTTVAVDRVRPFYSTEFMAQCVTATPETLTCVETADNAFTGLARCRLFQGSHLAEGLPMLPVVADVPWNAPEREVRDAAAADALRAALVGSWDRGGRETYVFTADGTVTRTSSPLPAEAGRFTATSGSRFFVTSSEGSNGSPPTDVRSAVVAGDTLYLVWGSDGYVQPIAESGPTLATDRGYWVIQDLRGTPRCTGFNLYGQPVQSARCDWHGEGDERRLRIMATFGNHLWTGESLPEGAVRFREMSGFLVPSDNGFRFFRRAGQSSTAPSR